MPRFVLQQISAFSFRGVLLYTRPVQRIGQRAARLVLPTSARRCGCLFIVHTEPAMHTRTDRG